MWSLLRVFRCWVWCGPALLVPVVAPLQGAQGLAGDELLLGGAVAGDQSFPSVSLGVAGGCLVWQDQMIDRNGWGIAAMRLDVNGSPVRGPSQSNLVFCVNSIAAGAQERPRVAALPDGGLAWVWQGGKLGFASIYARFMTAAGTFTSGDLLVSRPPVSVTNRYTALLPVVRNNRLTGRRFRLSRVVSQRLDYCANPVVVALADGSVLVAYGAYTRMSTNEAVSLPQTRYYGTVPVVNSVMVSNDRAMDLMQDIYLRRYTPTGVPIGAEVLANQFTAFNQRDPAVAVLANGNIVVAWVSENQGVIEVNAASNGQRQDVYARLFNASGVALGNEFRVNDELVGNNVSPSVAALAGGGFRVVWSQKTEDLVAGWDVVTRSFDALGTATAPVTTVNTFTRGDQLAPRVASSSAGELVVWTSIGQDGSKAGVFGQWISGGLPVGPEMQVNVSTGGNQYQPSLAAGPGGRFLVTWSGVGQGATRTGFDIFGRFFVP